MVPARLEHDFCAALDILSQSERHKNYSLADLQRLIVPPMLLGQYYVFDNLPADGVYVSWAFFSDEVEQAFIDQTRKLQPEDWKSGPNCWAIDVATIGNGSNALGQLFRDLRKELAPIHTFKYRRWYPNRPRRYVTMEFANAVPA